VSFFLNARLFVCISLPLSCFEVHAYLKDKAEFRKPSRPMGHVI